MDHILTILTISTLPYLYPHIRDNGLNLLIFMNHASHGHILLQQHINHIYMQAVDTAGMTESMIFMNRVPPKIIFDIS